MTGVQVKQRLVGKGVHREQENHQLVYVWPCWVFLAVCCVSFSVVAASGRLHRCSVWTSQRCGFPWCRAPALGRTGFSGCGPWALKHGCGAWAYLR